MKMVSKMDAIKSKILPESKNSQLVTISDSFWLYSENLTGMLLLFFSVVKYVR